MPSLAIDFVPDAATAQSPDAAQIDFQEDEAQDFREPSQPVQEATPIQPTRKPPAPPGWITQENYPPEERYQDQVERKKAAQESGLWDKMPAWMQKLNEPVPPEEQSDLREVGKFFSNFHHFLGLTLGLAGKGLEAIAGKIAGTGDTVEDWAKTPYGEPLPVEQAAAKVKGPLGVGARFGLGFLESAPKFAALAAVPAGAITEGLGLAGAAAKAVPLLINSIAAGGIGGLDSQGNWRAKDAAIWAVLPGVNRVASSLAGRGLAGAINSGATAFDNPLAKHLMELLGEQAALNTVMLAADSPDLLALYQQDPDRAWAHVEEMVGQNLGWAILGGARRAAGLEQSATDAFILQNKEKYGEMAHNIIRKALKKNNWDFVADLVKDARKKQAEITGYPYSKVPEDAQIDAAFRAALPPREPPPPPPPSGGAPTPFIPARM